MLTGGNQLIGTGDSLRSIAYYYGPSYVIADMEAEMWGHKLECIMMIGNVPITQDRFMMHFGMKVRALDNLSFSENQKLIAAYIANGQETFFQDLRIWDNKKRVDNPILCGGDGPVYQLREWYEQFYLDRDQIHAKTAEKRVFISRERADTAQWLMDVHGVGLDGQPVRQQEALLAPSDA
jgi:3-ketosteroid 9alpha-monooxygenase subunit A